MSERTDIHTCIHSGYEDHGDCTQAGGSNLLSFTPLSSTASHFQECGTAEYEIAEMDAGRTDGRAL